jgi:hypothetical protein
MLFQNWLSQATGEAVATSCKDIKILDFLGMELSYTMILKENKFHYSPLNPFFLKKKFLIHYLYVWVSYLCYFPEKYAERKKQMLIFMCPI